MSFCPAGFEDSDSDDEGFFMGGSSGYSAKTVNNKPDMNGMTGASSKDFTGISAGAESCNRHPEDVEFETSKAQTDGRRRQHSSQKTSDCRNDGATGLGRGRGQLQQRGRGRGGFPRPPSSYSNRGKSSRRFGCDELIIPRNNTFDSVDLSSLTHLSINNVIPKGWLGPWAEKGIRK